MSSLALGHGQEELELLIAGLFTAAELAAADLLLQLSGDDAAAPSTSTTRSSSPRSVSTCREGIAVDQEAQDLTVDQEERADKVLAVSLELDRRARKRYRLLSDLYAATRPETSALAAEKKRKMHHHHDGFGSSGSSPSEEATRYAQTTRERESS